MWLTEKFRLTASNFGPIVAVAVVLAVADHHRWVEAAAADLPDPARQIPRIEWARLGHVAPED